MEEISSIQKAIFQQIKERLPANISFIHEIGEVLNLSYDSTYRRVRGDKDLSFEELYKLSKHYGISIDALCNIDSNSIVFNCLSLESAKFEVEQWMQMILHDIKMIHEAKDKQVIYAAKDPPVFHYFQFPEIIAFKVFLWEKTLFQFPGYDEKIFRLQDVEPELYNTGQKILAYATKVPTIEIWNRDSFSIMLRQIEYYWVSGFFETKDDILNLIDKLEKWVQHIQKQAEYGFKYIYGQTPEGIENSYQFYENDVVLNDNTILAKVDDKTIIYLTFNVLSLLVTTNPFFCETIRKHLKGLMMKSNLLSMVSAKERNRFFNRIINNIEQFRSSIN
jgi:hypothetical protein